VSNFDNVFNSNARNIDRYEFPILHNICVSLEKITNSFTMKNENYRNVYIFENERITLNLESKQILSPNMFTRDFFDQHANALYKQKCSNFYDADDNIIIDDDVRTSTGLNLTNLQIFSFRSACAVAKIRFRKKDLHMKESLDVEAFFLRRRKGSSHLRALLYTFV
jgi:hypothetical protein